MLTQGRLREVLDYDPSTGLFLWKGDGIGRWQGCGAGSNSSADGYIRMMVDGKNYLAHRLVILCVDGYLPEGTVDHINRVRTDNRRVNLRETSQQCQNRNCGMLKNNTSGVKGIYLNKRAGKWQAQIKVNRQNRHLGYHDTSLEAAYHRYAAEQCLGFMDCDINSSAKQYIESCGMNG